MNLYQKELFDHYKRPHNYGKIENPAAITMREINSLCGDELIIYAIIEHGKINDVKFEGRGCVISQAAASMLSEKIKGRPVAALKKMTPRDALKKIGLEDLASGRLQCALLFYSTLKKLLI